MLTGLISALVLVAVSPNVWNPVEGAAIFVGEALFPLGNPALISVPLGFLGGYIGTLIGGKQTAEDEKKYREVDVKANTGISVQDVSH